ncbi:threonylcarbamoyl-AMP synthase [bacterium]|nr:threonylcarbamoyl-AMP synthase [bacterium]
MELIKTDKIKNIEAVIRDVGEKTGKGTVICYPTDTVYGLGADAFNKDAIDRIYEIKKREKNHPFSVIIGNVVELKSLIAEMQEYAPVLIEKFWPGALTLIFKSSEKIKASMQGKRDTIGIRLPDNKICAKLNQYSGGPLISTSANLTGAPPPHSIEEIPQEILEQCDYVLDFGTIRSSGASTVINVSTEIPRLVRKGAVPVEEIEKYCKQIIY